MIGTVITALARMDRTLLALLWLAVGLLVATVYFLVRSRMEQRRGRRVVGAAQAEAESYQKVLALTNQLQLR